MIQLVVLAILTACAGRSPSTPRVLAHRGVHQTFSAVGIDAHTCTAARIDPPTHDLLENTLPSMQAAFEAGADRLFDGGEIYAHAQDTLYLNKVMSYSAWGLALAQIPFIINFFISLRKPANVGANPWDATTLEWAAPSPPPHGNFATEPVVYRNPYEYSVPGHDSDYFPQFEPGAEKPEPVSAS